MKLTIVYDNHVFNKGIGLKADWGFGCVIETGETIILFDTGANGKILLRNMTQLGIDPSRISKIVISHEHWDHNGGLQALTAVVSEVKLYRLAKKRPSEHMHLISAEAPKEIAEGICTTGRLSGSVDEQSLVLKGTHGWTVLVGCSHPGVEHILKNAQQWGTIVGLVGGFHGFNSFNVVEDLKFICACHCTKHKRGLKAMFPEKIADCGVGKCIDLDA